MGRWQGQGWAGGRVRGGQVAGSGGAGGRGRQGAGGWLWGSGGGGGGGTSARTHTHTYTHTHEHTRARRHLTAPQHTMPHHTSPTPHTSPHLTLPSTPHPTLPSTPKHLTPHHTSHPTPHPHHVHLSTTPPKGCVFLCLQAARKVGEPPIAQTSSPGTMGMMGGGSMSAVAMPWLPAETPLGLNAVSGKPRPTWAREVGGAVAQAHLPGAMIAGRSSGSGPSPTQMMIGAGAADILSSFPEDVNLGVMSEVGRRSGGLGCHVEGG